MKFAIVIQGNPTSSQASQSALRFAKAVLARGHDVVRVFLYTDGVYLANRFVEVPQDEQDISRQWQKFATENNIEVIACIASCLRRGITEDSLLSGFEISGLGQLIDATMTADRVMTFGQ